MKKLLAVAVAAIAFATIPYLTSVQAEGNLAAPPAETITINITGTEVDNTAINIETGKYYRISLVSDGMEEVAFSAPEFMQDIHIRLLVIQGIEVHMQGLTFRSIEFDQGGTASFNFVAIRPGTYNFTIGDVAGTITVI
ncbi:MAG: hypothetical protein KIS96_08880 [Bauldia sp.]|nr:hypothetical protein [Bauldia sp.]